MLVKTQTSSEYNMDKPCLPAVRYLTLKNGLDAIKIISKINKKVPVVVLSNQKDMGVAINYMHLGAADYIVKSEASLSKMNNIIETLKDGDLLLAQK